MNLEQIEKGAMITLCWKRYMSNLASLKNTYRGRLHANKGLIQMSGVEDHLKF
jgi:glucosamine--fructose-6-phosphate aminotransferase (isomerizing)